MIWRFFSKRGDRIYRFALAAILCSLLATSAHAQTWDGGGVAGGAVTWSTPANWNPDGVPVNNGTANIIMANNVDTVNTVDVNFDINSLTFNNTAGAFILSNSGGAALTIRGGGVTNNDVQLQQFALPIILGASQSWSATSGNITTGGSLNLGANQLTVVGANQTTLLGTVSGTGSIIKNGSGEFQITAGSNLFSGGLTLNSGTLTVGNSGALGTGTLSINGGTIQALSLPISPSNLITIGGNFIAGGSQNITFSGAATLTGNRTITTDNIAGTIFSGAIGQDIAGRTLMKSGAGTLTLSGSAANTYTGTTSVSAGTLVLAKTAGVNTVAGSFLAIGDGSGGAGADIARLGASNQIVDSTSVVVGTSGLFDLNGFSESIGQLQVHGGNVTTGAGILTINSGFHEGSFNLTSTITGNLALATGFTVQFSVEDGTPTTDLNISAAISGSGQLTKALPGTLELSGTTPNTYTNTTFVPTGTLLLNKSDGVVAVPGDLFINGGTVSAISEGQFGASTDVDISNFGLLAISNDNTISSLGLIDGVVSTSLAALTVSGPITVSNTASNSSFIQGTGTLVLTGAGTGVSVADGAPVNDLEIFPAVNSITGLTKTGSGQLVLNGNVANSIAGTTSVNEGTLVLAKSSASVTALSGNIVVGDGVGGADADILRLGENHQIAQLVSETVTVNSSGFFDLNGRTETIGNLQVNAGRVSGGTIGFTGTVTSSAQNTTAQINSHIDLLGSTTQFNVGDGLAGDDLLLTGVLQNGSLQKVGTGTLKLAGANPNTATLAQVTNGTVVMEKNTGVNAVGGATVIVSDGAGPSQGDILRYGANDHQLPDTMEVHVQSAGLFDLNGRSDTIGTLTMNGSGVVETGAGMLSVASQVASSINAATGTINGNLNLAGGNRPFNIANGAPATDLIVAATMSNGTLVKQGGGTLALSGGALTSQISYQVDTGELSAAGLVINSGRSFTHNGGAFSGTLTNHGAFIYNAGSFGGQLVNKSSGSATFNANFTAVNGLANEGTITIASGRVVTASGAGLTNDGTIVLDGGTLQATATFNFINNELVSGHGEIFASNVNFANLGDIVVSGDDLTLNSNFSPINNGVIFVPNNLKLQLLGAGNMQNNGLIFLDGGKVTGPGGLSNLLGGEIRGGSSVETPLTNAGGLIHATGPGTLTINALTGNTAGGELRIDDGATMNVQSSFSSSGTIVLAGANSTFSGGTITNTGTLRGPGRVNNVVANSGTIRAENGTLTLAAAGHTNAVVGSIEAGAGTQVLYSQGLATNSGQIALTGGSFDNNNVALANPGIIAGNGTIRTGGLTNTGAINIGGSLDVLGPVTQNATVSTQTGTTVRFFGPVTGSGSYLGTGTAMFLNSLSPGASPGKVTADGTLIFTGTNTLIMELAGTMPETEYDVIVGNGSVILGGTLDVDLLGGFTPAPGNSFQLINVAGGVSGTFSNVLFPALSGASWHLRYTPNSVLLQSGLKGDYNLNGTVDAADYVVWLKTQGATGFGLAADGDGDNQIDSDDYNVWQTHFGNTFGGGSGGSNSPAGDLETAVPEPSSLILLAFTLGIFPIAFRRRLY